MAKVGLSDNKGNHVEELCRLHNKLKGFLLQKIKSFLKNVHVYLVKYSQSTLNFDSYGKMHCLSIFLQ